MIYAGTGFTIGDGGIETALEERLGQVLPEFAAYVMLDTHAGRKALREYYRPFIELAAERNIPLQLDTATWRANPDWIARVDGELGPVAAASRLDTLNTDAVTLVRELATRIAPEAKVEIYGVVGPRFDDFDAAQRMTADEAEAYHAPQVQSLAYAGADRVCSVTTLDAAEGLGVVRAALAVSVPVVVSFTVGSDGLLADGSTLATAIRVVDAGSDSRALGFAVNCAHPSEVVRGIDPQAPEMARILGFRLNAAHEGDDGPGDAPTAFAEGVAQLARLVPNATQFGGCCGTDIPHIKELAEAL
ncbi:MAG: homocysteine S-methyltransferase family protein [Leucobacter sp.]